MLSVTVEVIRCRERRGRYRVVYHEINNFKYQLNVNCPMERALFAESEYRVGTFEFEKVEFTISSYVYHSSSGREE